MNDSATITSISTGVTTGISANITGKLNLTLSDEQLNTLAERFCTTELPKSVCSDGCATDPDYPHPRYGTNLMTVAEAKDMLQAVLKNPF